MIAVVIRYFQRVPGTLVNALSSGFASEGVEEVCVIVVDDALPVSDCSVKDLLPIVCIEQHTESQLSGNWFLQC